MSNLPFAGIKLEIMAIPTAAGRCRYEVYVQSSTSRSGPGPSYMTPCSTFDSASAICELALGTLGNICAQFTATNTAPAQLKKYPAKPFYNPLLSENSGIA